MRKDRLDFPRVDAKLPIRILRTRRRLPVRHVVRSAAARHPLEANGVDFRPGRNTKAMANPEIADAARQYTLVVECR